VRIKICGVTEPVAIRTAVDAGVDLLGFVFAPSERRVEPARAAELARGLPDSVATVGVFRYPSTEEIDHVLSGFELDFVQAEPGPAVRRRVVPSRVLSVFHDSDSLLERASRFRQTHGPDARILLEAAGRGGRGIRPDWSRAASLARNGKLILAGGLTPDNVAAAIRQVRPYGVDVSSGVESRPGVKDPRKITAFVEAVRDIEQELGS
jgi:phosphoribosylanthranilate isomerase